MRRTASLNILFQSFAYFIQAQGSEEEPVEYGVDVVRASIQEAAVCSNERFSFSFDTTVLSDASQPRLGELLLVTA